MSVCGLVEIKTYKLGELHTSSRWLRGQRILAIWLVGNKNLFVGPSYFRPMSTRMLTWLRFLWVLAPRVCLVEESLFKTRMETQTLLKQTILFFQIYTNSTICIFLWTSTLFSQVKFVQGPLDLTTINTELGKHALGGINMHLSS
jgi:hypothetical protein